MNAKVDPGHTATEPPEDRPAGTCGACPHPWTDHDQVSMRFCTATVAGGYRRGCACPAG